VLEGSCSKKGGSHVSAQSLIFGALVVAAFVSGASAQEIYRWRDAQGTIHFADVRPPYPADVTVLDGRSSEPARPAQPALKDKSRRSSTTSSEQRTASRMAPANRSISSLIDGGPRSRPRRLAADEASAEPPSTNAGTTLSDLSSQTTVVRRFGRTGAARNGGLANDLAVPSLDGALSQNLPAESGSGSSSTH